MSKKNIKTITLRAFEIANPDPTRKTSNLIKHMNDRLNESHVNDRKMLISSLDKSGEADVIPDFNIDKKYIKGAMMRIVPKDDIHTIPDTLLSKNKFSIEELNQIDTKNSIMYKSHFYFAASNTHVVTNLSRTTTIRSFQAYINWLLESQREDFLYEFTPAVRTDDQIQLSEIQKISITDPDKSKNKNIGDKENVSKKNLILNNFAIDYLTNIFSDSKDLEGIKKKQIVNAELLITFVKPKEMDESDYKNAIGALLKPMSDIDNTTFHTKTGKIRKASDLLKFKQVEINLTESGRLSEQEVYQAMEKYLKEL